MNPATPAAAKGAGRPRERAPGLRIGTKLVLTFFGFALAFAATLTFVYQKYVPPLVMQQIDLRTSSMASQLGSAVLEPLVVRNYLRVNKIAEVTSGLPDVAYTAVINPKGIPVAGIFGKLDTFDSAFVKLVKLEGFPKSLVDQNRLQPGAKSSMKAVEVGGQHLREVAMAVGDTGAEVRVAIFTSAVEVAVRNTMIPLLMALAALVVLGLIAVILIARNVSAPIRHLTREAQRISMGQVDQPIEIKGGGEIWELAQAFARMQTAIKYAVEQLRRSRAAAAPPKR